MSAIEKLEALLSRVQTRKAAPRPVASAEVPFAAPAPGTGRVSKVPVPTPLEESMEMLVPVERSRDSLPSAFEARAPEPQTAPPSDELFLDDFEPPATVQPAASAQASAPVAMPPAAAVPAPAAPVAAAPAPAPAPKPAPITAATARIAPAAATAASPVSVVSAAPRFEPKSFGDLLELSLALRPLK